ncbi:LysR family transcriptional regulator [Burkholderia sp. LMU1-1-1.1]|uniref:LysR family transcriptional regulator n=1 Tax=Burkholderia sp. LMU1-1-1.1 TaxID=3135266 RepID=UPI00343C80A9
MALRFKLRQLEMFLALAETLNFREAAARLHMTQPPLSRQIQELETALGAQLLHRSNHGVTLTQAGETLVKEASELLRACEKMAQRFHAEAGKPGGRLEIGLTTVVDTEKFTRILPLLQADIPNLEIDFKRQTSMKSVRDIHHDRLDAAIIGMPSTISDLTVQHLYRDRFCVALAKGHRLAHKKTVSLADLNEEVLFWFRRELNAGFYDHCEELFKRIQFAPQRIPEPADHHVLLSMVANDGGIGLIPQSLQKIRHGGVVFRALKEDQLLFIDIGIAYKPASANPMLISLIGKLMVYFRSGAATA